MSWIRLGLAALCMGCGAFCMLTGQTGWAILNFTLAVFNWWLFVVSIPGEE